MAKTARKGVESEEALRDWCWMLGLWRVCDRAACQRARACRGNVRACTPRNFALVPEGVQAWFVNLMLGKEDGLSFDESLARIEGTPVEEEFFDWNADDERVVRTL